MLASISILLFNKKNKMKKLKLSLVNMQGTEILSREQLKKVIGGSGGSGGGQCAFRMDCGEGENCVLEFGERTCKSVDKDGACDPNNGNQDCGNGQYCIGLFATDENGGLYGTNLCR